MRIQYTYTYVKHPEHQRFQIRYTYLALFAGISIVTNTNTHTFGKGFLQNEVLGEVFHLEGGSTRRSFCRSLGRSFWRSFRACFDGTFRATKNFSKNFSPENPRLCTANLAKIQGKTSLRGSAGGPLPNIRENFLGQ